MALAWEDLGEYRKAEAYYKKAMDIMEALRPGSLLEIAVTWVNLAVLYETVSYTHLDVYKRQGRIHSPSWQ